MDVIPAISVARFEKLKPGDLFIYLNAKGNCVALKTQVPTNNDPCLVALLGPTFPSGTDAPVLINWQAATTISFGQDYSVLLPTDPSAWSDTPPPAEILCLAQSDDKLYLRINGAQRPNQFYPYFIELVTGALVEAHLKGITAYALTWDLAVLGPNISARSILKFPYN